MTMNTLNPTRQPAASNLWEGPSMPQSPNQTAVLTIHNLPRDLRPSVESAMVVCIPSPSALKFSGEDPRYANWCTTWHPSQENRRSVECRELITGTERELGHLRDILSSMAQEHCFDAALSLLR